MLRNYANISLRAGVCFYILSPGLLTEPTPTGVSTRFHVYTPQCDAHLLQHGTPTSFKSIHGTSPNHLYSVHRSLFTPDYSKQSLTASTVSTEPIGCLTVLNHLEVTTACLSPTSCVPVPKAVLTAKPGLVEGTAHTPESSHEVKDPTVLEDPRRRSPEKEAKGEQ